MPKNATFQLYLVLYSAVLQHLTQNAISLRYFSPKEELVKNIARK